MRTASERLLMINPYLEMERFITKEKLDEGINGLEWLVLHVDVDVRKLARLNQWYRRLEERGQEYALGVMSDVLTMEIHEFQEKRELNWWASIESTITYLSILKKKDYDRYFDFLQQVYGDQSC